MDIGMIGLGAMGSVMARNLAAAGHKVSAWNRSRVMVEGVTMVADPAEAFRGDAVVTMLPDDDAIRDVLLDSGVLAGAEAPLVHVVSSTISVAFAQRLVDAHESAGIGYVAAPVLGRPDVAAKGALNVLAAGTPTAVDAARPILEVLGSRTWDMGAKPPSANAAKIACNMMITMAIEAMAEGVVLSEANGLDRNRFFDLILNTLFGSRSYQVYSANIAGESYDPGFKATLGLKDLRLAREAAAQAGRTLPMLDAVQARMAEAVDAGLGDRDWSIMADYTIRSKGAGAMSAIGLKAPPEASA